jgi:hypothetical protein
MDKNANANPRSEGKPTPMPVDTIVPYLAILRVAIDGFCAQLLKEVQAQDFSIVLCFGRMNKSL